MGGMGRWGRELTEGEGRGGGEQGKGGGGKRGGETERASTRKLVSIRNGLPTLTYEDDN